MSTAKENSEPSSPPIAVVGISALFPGSQDARGFWQDILQGRDQIREIPPDYWLIEDYYDPDPSAPDKTYGKRGAFLEPTPFDAMAYGVPPNVVQQTDTSQLLGLIVAQQVLEDAAGGDFAHLDKSRISVILGATGTTELVVHLGSRLQRPIWLNALRQNGIPEDEAQAICDRIAASYVPWTEASFPGLLGNVIAGRIANKFDLGGTNCVVDAACASSLSALAMGLGELYTGQSDMVIVGGVDTLNDILMYMCFSKTPALSAAGDCRPFSDKADGTILGEGLGMLALRRLEDAERDGDRIYAVIRGLGSSSDGKGTAVYAPKASGQAHALRRAYAAAGYSPRTVELLEAHGTATKAGDAAEFEGASSVFAEAAREDQGESAEESKQWCAIGSVKSQIGHTKGAAGAASLIKAVLALHHKVLPPTIKVDRPNPNLRVEESPFYINTQARPWVRDSAHPRRAGVSSFGFGGSNFHVTLEEYTGEAGRKGRFRTAPTELFLLRAENGAELAAAAERLAERFAPGGAGAGATGGRPQAGDFQYLARETQLRFAAGEAPAQSQRLAVVAKDFADLQAKLEAAAAAIRRDEATAQRSPAGWYYGGNAGEGAGKIAFLFPGQGSQYVGMGGDLAGAFAESQAIWDHAAELEFEQGGRLQEVVFPRPVFDEDAAKELEARLRATDWAQPAIGVTSLSQLVVLQRLGLTPDVTGGHSFGEVTALYAAGALDQKAFLHVARKRGELMAEAAAMFPGAMTAIAHPAAEVAELLAGWDTGVVIANHNAPDQVVISGIVAAVEACEARLQAAGIRHQRLPVATAFHSSVVRPATAPFHAYLNHVPVHPPQLPVYANSTAAVYSGVPEAIRETLADQLALPVLFAEQVEAMYAAGVRTFVEVGPGTVLTNLVKNILRERPHLPVALDRKGEHGLTSLWQALGQLAAAGVALDFAALWEGVAVGPDPQGRRTPKLAVPISGVNYGKPYPPKGGAAGKAPPNGARPEVRPEVRHEPQYEAGKTRANGVPGNGTPGNGTPGNGIPANRERVSEAPAAVMINGIGTHGSAAKQQSGQPAGNKPADKPMNNPSNYPTQQSTTSSLAQAAGTGNGQAAHSSAPAAQPLSQPLNPAPAMPAAPVQPVQFQPAPVQPVQVQPAPSEALAWAGVFQELQRQTAAAHMAFLQVAEQSIRSLEAMLTGGAARPVQTVNGQATPVPPPAQVQAVWSAPAALPLPQPPAPAQMPPQTPPGVQVYQAPPAYAPPPAVPSPAVPSPVVMAPPPVVAPAAPPARPAPAPAPVPVAPRAAAPVVPVPVAPPSVAPPPVAVPVPVAPVAAPAPAAAPGADLHGIMMEVVTEKTGYPTEMLEPQMALDTDLGIDSIKRVEILAAMRERVPALPEFDTNVMAGLRTLGEIVTYMDSQLPASMRALGGQAPSAAAPVTPALAAVPVAVPVPVAPVAAPAPAAAPGADLHGIMMEVVTEKTGYPTEMLEPQMALDTDLGIDSIKRVEILAAMRERVPALPEFDTNVMAGLRTLGEIVTYMDSQLPASMRAQGREQGANVPAAEVGYAAAATDPPATVDLSTTQDPIRRFVTQTVERPAPGLTPPFLMDGTTVCITDDGRGVAPALAQRLQEAGATVQVCAEVPPGAQAVICLAGLMAGDRASAAEINGAAFAAAAAVAQTMETQGGLFVTVQDTGGDGGLATDPGERAWFGGLSGLAKTAAQEWPRAVVRSIDLATELTGAPVPPATAAARLAQELLNGGAELEIGLPADGRRLEFVSVAVPAAGGAPVVDDRSVLVVAGGGRGVTAAALIALAQAARPHIALLGRTVLEPEPQAVAGIYDDAGIKKALLAAAQAQGQRISPRELGSAADRIQAAREIRGTLAALTAAGAQALYLPCDVGDAAATAQALAAVRAQWGPITGIVHGAGVLADKRLVEKTPEDFRRVFGAKVHGLRALLDATQDDPLTVICLFSSVAGRTGNAGQADYAMANEVLNRVAQAEAKRRPGCVVKSIGWGPWAGGMVTPVLKAKFDELGVPLIPLATGAAAFVAELQAARRDEVETVIGGMPQAAPLLATGNGNGTGQGIEGGVAQAARPFVYDVAVSAATQPYLADHEFNGTVVLPLVLVQEWLLRAAATVGLAGPGVSLHKVRVRKGLPLPEFGAHPVRLRVRGEPLAARPGVWSLTLVDAEGTVRFTAEAAAPGVSAAPDALQPAAPWQMANAYAHAGNGQNAGQDGAQLYGRELFHGPQFGAIQTVEWVEERGAGALLVGGAALGWPQEAWCSDPPLLDGALQLARVWGYALLGRPTLPTACERLTIRRPGLRGGGALRCVVQGKSIGGAGTRSDLWLIDPADQSVVAEIHGLEMYVSSEPPVSVRADMGKGSER